MKKDFGAKAWLYPMPVLIIGSYDADGKPDAMMRRSRQRTIASAWSETQTMSFKTEGIVVSVEKIARRASRGTNDVIRIRKVH